MLKIAIVYHSETGNTRRQAELIESGCLQVSGVQTKLMSERCDPEHVFGALPDAAEDEVAVEDHAAAAKNLKTLANPRHVEALSHGQQRLVVSGLDAQHEHGKPRPLHLT